MQVIIDRTVADEIVARLSERDRRVGEDAGAAVEWLTGFDGDEVPAVFSRRELQLFLWHQLPKKWLVRTAEQQAVAEALACFFDEVGAEAAPLAWLCRSLQTTRLIRNGGKNLAAALDRSGLEPPDTPLLTWSAFMGIEEALEHDLVAGMLEDAIDAGALVPGAAGWRKHQTELVEHYLANPDASGTAPLNRIHTARRLAWLDLPGRGPDERELLEHALAASDPCSRAEAEQTVEPMLWLLDQLAAGVKLTQTGALPRALVRAAVERYPDWWDTNAVGPPYQEAELYPLCVLHDLVDQLKLARRQRSTLQLTPKGRALHADPQRLLSELTAALAQDLPADLDLTRPRRRRRSSRDQLAAVRTAHAVQRNREPTPDTNRHQPGRTHPRRLPAQRPRPRAENEPELTSPTGSNRAIRIKKPFKLAVSAADRAAAADRLDCVVQPGEFLCRKQHRRLAPPRPCDGGDRGDCARIDRVSVRTTRPCLRNARWRDQGVEEAYGNGDLRRRDPDLS